jgi:hypothetical protein
VLQLFWQYYWSSAIKLDNSYVELAKKEKDFTKIIVLRILNKSTDNTLHYLVCGVTSIEMKIEDDDKEAFGFISPMNRTNGKNKFYLGYTDKSKDFLVLW